MFFKGSFIFHLMKSVFTKIIGKKIGRRFSIIRGKKNTGKQKSINSALPKKCPYSELFSPAFSRSRIEYGEIRSISPYSVRMWENADQNNSEYGHFSRSAGQFRNFLYAICFASYAVTLKNSSDWLAVPCWFNGYTKLLTHIMPLVSFYTPWKHQKTEGFADLCGEITNFPILKCNRFLLKTKRFVWRA